MQQDQLPTVASMASIQVIRRNAHFNLFASCRLTWWEELGLGYYPVETGTKPYDEAYFERYKEQANSAIGKLLMASRVSFVNLHIQRWEALCDVGIGSGAFIEARNQRCPEASIPVTYGFDVNPKAIEWLRKNGLWQNPYEHIVNNASFWDVLEHLDNPATILRPLTWAFISIPIFRNVEHVLQSKHYRKDEHVWYFTARGLIWYMDQLGFSCVTRNDMETRIGREDIGTFAFKRRELESVHRT